MPLASLALAATLALGLALAPAHPAPAATPAGADGDPTTPTNILFVILDDVGADQLTVSNPAGVGLPHTPAIEAIASQGVNFTNCWSMPECSPSRVCFFTGRFPGRTGVGSPLTQSTLPQSQCSPYEATTPRILNDAGYATALFGKFHLAQNENNPFDLHAPASVGFTHFNGTLLGGPPYIDETVAGQVTAEGVASCGFPVAGNAPAICACAFEDGSCVTGVDALECLAAGGVPLTAADGSPIAECDADAAALIDWSNFNGNYAWPRTVNLGGVAYQETPARVHADTDQAEHAIAFINAQQSAGSPWMCTLSFTGDHDPWQAPPAELLPPGTHWPAKLPYACDVQDGVAHAGLQQRTLSDWTIESMDTQIRRVLLATGLASLAPGSGGLTINAPDTLIVVIGDNGSFLTTVKLPFNPTRAKATAYQTGVSVPLVMAGGPTIAPGRSVDAMVNVVDLYELWGEAAGVDVHAAVPAGRVLDCHPVMPYLVNPAQAEIRDFNFTEYIDGELSEPCYPCLIASGGSSICTDTILTTAQLCESQGGVWYGPGGATTGQPQDTCCELYAALGDPAGFSIVYSAQQAITDGRWKLIANAPTGCSVPGLNEYEFYDLSQCFAAAALGGRGIDNPDFDLLTSGTALTPEQQLAYDTLFAALQAIDESMAPCLGDITMDGVVDAADLTGLLSFWGGPSVADLNNDAVTDGADLALMLTSWGGCPVP